MEWKNIAKKYSEREIIKKQIKKTSPAVMQLGKYAPFTHIMKKLKI